MANRGTMNASCSPPMRRVFLPHFSLSMFRSMGRNAHPAGCLVAATPSLQVEIMPTTKSSPHNLWVDTMSHDARVLFGRSSPLLRCNYLDYLQTSRARTLLFVSCRHYNILCFCPGFFYDYNRTKRRCLLLLYDFVKAQFRESRPHSLDEVS